MRYKGIEYKVYKDGRGQYIEARRGQKMKEDGGAKYDFALPLNGFVDDEGVEWMPARLWWADTSYLYGWWFEEYRWYSLCP